MQRSLLLAAALLLCACPSEPRSNGSATGPTPSTPATIAPTPSSPPYQPPPPPPAPPPPEATASVTATAAVEPPPAATASVTGTATAHSVDACVADCVKKNQMKAIPMQQIEKDCRTQCSGGVCRDQTSAPSCERCCRGSSARGSSFQNGICTCT
jgi:hypothetical protein